MSQRSDYQLWKHKKSGEVYNVQLSNQQEAKVVNAIGPLHYSEYTGPDGEIITDIENYNWDGHEDADWMDEHEWDFDHKYDLF